VLVSRGLEDIFPLAMVQKVVRDYSDHNLLLLNLSNDHAKRSTTSSYELLWEKGGRLFA
jgi:hypothetical protein